MLRNHLFWGLFYYSEERFSDVHVVVFCFFTAHSQRNQRNILNVSDISNTGNSSSVGFHRTSSFRNRFQNDDTEKKKEETKDLSKDSKGATLHLILQNILYYYFNSLKL